MKIASLDARSYSYPLDPPFRPGWDPNPRIAFSETIVAVHSDEGVSGYCGGATVPDLELLSELLVESTLDDPERVFSVCETVDFHGGRNWTVEVAVWDLLARAADQPLWQFLGGDRDRYPAYQSTGEMCSPEERVMRLQAGRELGFTAAKLRLRSAGWRQDLELVEKARSEMGAEFHLMVDANQGWRMPGDLTPRWDFATALECVRICGDLGVFWLEEPLATNQIEDYVKLASETKVLLAGGEMTRSLTEVRRLISAVDVIQTDVVLAGGVSGCRQVAQWAEEAVITWSPHTWSTGYGLLANLQVALAFSNGTFLEYPFDPPGWTTERRDFMLPEPVDLDQEGNIVAPAGAGLGMVPDFDFLEQWRVA